MNCRLFLCILGILGFKIGYSQLKSPKAFLPTNFTQNFTPHHELVNYFQHVSSTSKRVKLSEYGKSVEDRPMMVAFISSPENIADLENIRLTNLYNTGLLKTKPTTINEKTIVWLSFGVHGNEAATSESSMEILYQLANESNSTTAEYLKNTVVIMDPSLNPDGYSRYTHWARGVMGKKVHPAHTDREHQEPWPGGRVNHYLFDLNRDWAWMTQKETQQRTKFYNTWMPHIYADFHEMGYNSPYYFAPAAKPYHEFITGFQRDFQLEIGQNHARYFDKEGWLYYTREIFDLLYPSYGDTYPTYNGAIGMTYEKGGSGMAGRSIVMENGNNVTLEDRIKHNVAAGLSTVEVE